VVFEGRGHMTTPTAELALRRGLCCILRGGEHYIAEQDERQRLGVTHIHFDVVGVDGLSSPAVSRALFPLVREMVDMSFFDGLLLRVVRHWQAGDEAGAVWWLMSALREVRGVDQHERQAGWQPRTAERLDAICDRVRDDPGAVFSVSALAAELGCCPDHFSRLFRRHTGIGPREFHLRTRMDRARYLLRYTAEPVRAVALALGFSDVPHFTRQFTQRTGRSPAAYRRHWTAAVPSTQAN
jgi:AraC-like DNA-binding protein